MGKFKELGILKTIHKKNKYNHLPPLQYDGKNLFRVKQLPNVLSCNMKINCNKNVKFYWVFTRQKEVIHSCNNHMDYLTKLIEKYNQKGK